MDRRISARLTAGVAAGALAVGACGTTHHASSSSLDSLAGQDPSISHAPFAKGARSHGYTVLVRNTCSTVVPDGQVSQLLSGSAGGMSYGCQDAGRFDVNRTEVTGGTAIYGTRLAQIASVTVAGAPATLGTDSYLAFPTTSTYTIDAHDKAGQVLFTVASGSLPPPIP